MSYMIKVCLIFLRKTAKLRVFTTLRSYQQCMNNRVSIYLKQHLILAEFFFLQFSNRCVVIYSHGFNLPLPIASDVKHLLTGLFDNCMLSLVKCVFVSFAHF